MKFLFLRSAVIIVVIMVWSAIAAAQGTTAVILGTVRDATGAVLPGANIQVKNQATGSVRNVATDSGGRYRVPALEVGTYEVQASLAGFSTAVKSTIELTVGSEVMVDLQMQVGEVSQSVTVTGEVPLVNTTNATLSGLVGDKEIRDLPLNGRSYDQLAFLQPGVVKFSFGPSTTSSFVFNGAGVRMSIAGTPLDYVSFLLDGTDLHDYADFTPGAVTQNNLGVDSLLEFRVLTQNYSAEYGRSGGGVITTVSRAGTNSLHGGLFEFIRNSDLDARQFFDVGSAPPFRRNQFGAFAGGPIVRDRTFIFANYEGLRQRLSSTYISTVPDANARTGNLPSGNVAVNPAIQPYLALAPLPNGRDYGDGTAQFFWTFNNPTRQDYGMIRIDHNFSEKYQLFARVTVDEAGVTNPGAQPRFMLVAGSRNSFSTVELKSVLSPQTLNSIRFAFNRTAANGVPSASPAPPANLSFIPGLPWAINFASSTGAGALSSSLSTIGYNPASAPYRFPQNLYQLTDDVYVHHGAHALRMGVNMERIQNNDYENSQSGTYSFGNLTALLNAAPFQFSANTLSSVNGFAYRQWHLGTYVQDDYQLTSRLTLNLGLRYEFTTVPTETHGWRANILNVATDTTRTIGKTINNPSLHNFEPRFGFAWTPTGKADTVIRGGFGVYHNELMGKLTSTFSENGFTQAVTVANPAFTVPNANLANIPAGSFTYFTANPNLKTPTVYQDNLTVERQLPSDFVVSVGYAGMLGRHWLRLIESNTLPPQFLADGTPFYIVGQPRMNPNFGGVRRILSDANGNYNALQFQVTKSFSHGLRLQSSYTYSKALTDSTGWRPPQQTNTPDASLIFFEPHDDYSASPFSQNQTYSFNSTYRFPGNSLTGLAGTLASGWEMNAIFTAASGIPFTAELTSNQSGDGNLETPDRPNLAPGCSNNPLISNVNKWYNSNCFSFPARGFYGNLGRNTLRAPGLTTLDFALVKNFHLAKERLLTFRAEVFNFLNHPNFGLPNLVVFTSAGVIAGNAGAITTLNTASRQMQFGLRFSF